MIYPVTRKILYVQSRESRKKRKGKEGRKEMDCMQIWYELKMNMK